MSTVKPFLAIAGDIGGARAILPALVELENRFCAFAVADHRFLTAEAPGRWTRVRLPEEDHALQETLQANYSACLFGTSVADSRPLHVARAAKAAGLPTIAVLDNWMNYRMRLETDGGAAFIPDAYAVMDELARAEAILDGVPDSCLRVVGHAGLASLADDAAAFATAHERSAASEADVDKKLVVFISEPAEQDQGADERDPGYRGYTEKTVLTLLSECLQPFYESVQIGLVPHPRENAEELLKHWARCRGKLAGRQMPVQRGRDAVFMADAVCGMSSLLLLEALLLGKPVLSLQPGLRIPQLDFLKKKGLTHFVTDETLAPQAVREWIMPILASRASVPAVHHELELHRGAASNLADLVQELVR